MNIKRIDSGISQRRIPEEPLTTYEYEAFAAEKLNRLLGQLKNDSHNISIVDTYRDKDGNIKQRAVTFLNTEKNADEGSFLDDIV